MFRTVIMDPPWPEFGGGKITRGAQAHYRLCRNRDEVCLTVKGALVLAAPDGFEKNAHCYIWATNNFIPDGIWLMEQLGFTYKTNVVWVKKKIALGQYFRGQHEILLFGVRGKGMDESVYSGTRNIPSVIHADHVRGPSGKVIHSAKPKEFIDLIVKRSKGPYLELFARRQPPVPDWVCWGPDAGLGPGEDVEKSNGPLFEEEP